MRAACPSNKHNLCEACTGISSPQVWPVRLADAYEYRCTERACKHRSNISGCFICVSSKARTYRYLWSSLLFWVRWATHCERQQNMRILIDTIDTFNTFIAMADDERVDCGVRSRRTRSLCISSFIFITHRIIQILLVLRCHYILLWRTHSSRMHHRHYSSVHSWHYEWYRIVSLLYLCRPKVIYPF